MRGRNQARQHQDGDRGETCSQWAGERHQVHGRECDCGEANCRAGPERLAEAPLHDAAKQKFFTRADQQEREPYQQHENLGISRAEIR